MKNISILTFLIIMVSASVFGQGYRVNRTNEKTKPKVKSSGLGKNIIAISPVNIAVNSMMSDGRANAAVGFSYERIFDNEYLSIKLPFNFTIEKPGVFIMPTIKFYPKKQGAVKYAIGPQFLISYVDDYPNYYLMSSQYPYTPHRELRRQFGFGLNNSINITVSKHLYAGMEATVGLLYYDSFNDGNYYNNGNYYNGNYYGQNSTGLDINQSFSAGFTLGCRF